MVYKGSCLCGGIHLEVRGAISDIIHCHCSLCRKSSGTAYATNGFVASSDFTITQGRELLSAYMFKPGKYRHFCSVCGSPVYSSSDLDNDRIRIRLGVFDTDISETPASHIFMSSKANWDDPDRTLPRYDAFEPGRK